jgi:hypothetical protein
LSPTSLQPNQDPQNEAPFYYEAGEKNGHTKRGKKERKNRKKIEKKEKSEKK